MKKFLKIALWIFVGLLFVGTFVYLYLNSQTKPEVYGVVTPAMQDIECTAVLTGKIEPRDEIEIKPQINGIITEIKVEAGDMVQQGDVIAVIEIVPEASQLSSAQSRIDAAQVSLTAAQQKYNRARQLLDAKVIAREEFETAETELARAKSELEGAHDAMRVVRNGVSKLNAGKGSTQVRATISGLVLDVPVKVGASVIQSNTFNAGTTIATIADMSNLIFKGTVDETEVGRLAVGQAAKISIGALPEAAPLGVIEYISPKAVNNGGVNTFEVKTSLSNLPANGLRAGYSANATVSLKKLSKVLTVPESSVEFSGDSTFVYILTDSVPVQQWKRTAVTTGDSDGLNIQIKKGIDKNARIRGIKQQQQ